MKKIAMLMMGLIIMIISVNAKELSYSFATYGANISQSQTGSGFGTSTNVSFNVQVNNRLFELGYLMNSKTREYMGIEFQYKHFLGFYKNQRSGGQYNKLIKPFLYYNFIYHAPVEVDGNVTLNGTTSATIATKGQMTSFEHSFGVGFQVKLLGALYLENSIGFGAYLGSKYQGTEKPSTMGIHKDNFGFVPSFHVGFGYQF